MTRPARLFFAVMALAALASTVEAARATNAADKSAAGAKAAAASKKAKAAPAGPRKPAAAAKTATAAKKSAPATKQSAPAEALKSTAAKPAPVKGGSYAPLKTPPVPRPRPAIVATAAVGQTVGHVLTTASLSATPASAPVTMPTPDVRATAADLAAAKQALALIRKGRSADASALQATVTDPVIHKLIEWAILRSDDHNASAARNKAFITANPNWATVRTFRRRAENLLWAENPSPDAVRGFFKDSDPWTPKGRFTLARALLSQGDRSAALGLVREAWRKEDFGPDLEEDVLKTFSGMITRADHKARMDRQLYTDDSEAGLRAANRLGGFEVAIAKARISLIKRESKAAALIDALPREAQSDPGVLLSRITVLRRQDKIAEAAQLMLAASRDPTIIHDTDEWWVERRLVARKLLDIGDPQTAYRIAREAAPPTKDNYRAEHQFTAGWIALRFLNQPAAALEHFARVGKGANNPITLARAAYWQGRALEALGRHQDARTHFTAAARYPTAYYGQIARNKLGLAEVGLRRPPFPEGAQLAELRKVDIVRAVEILYAIGERDFVYPMVADLADRVVDIGALVLIAELTTQNKDARALLLIGKAVLAKGYAFDHYAFPTVGVPSYNPIGPEVDRSVVYSIVRQESAFKQQTVSSAKALGLMQVTPPAGRYIAKKFGVTFDQKRLLSDPVYNTQMGSAELGDLLRDYRGSYILSFAAYNAGRGRVSEWIKRFGDPRSADVDPIDWVERIPFSETRNYVQRVMENMQVYRARFTEGARLLMEADLRRGSN